MMSLPIRNSGTSRRASLPIVGFALRALVEYPLLWHTGVAQSGGVAMSELVDPTVTLEFYEISHRGRNC